MDVLIIGAVALNLYALTLVLLRGPLYRVKLYRPMVWNIWLSVLPILILSVGGLAGTVAMLASPVLGVVILVATAIVWLLMLPNASYLITELNLSHRKEDDPTPLWYDIILVISLAMSGVINTTVNVFVMHVLVSTTFYGDTSESLLKPGVLATVAVVLLLLGVGMYLGRYPRFNSWDLKHPVSFARKLVDHFKTRENVLACAGFTITYALFLAIIYVTAAGSVIQGLIQVEHVRDILG